MRNLSLVALAGATLALSLAHSSIAAADPPEGPRAMCDMDDSCGPPPKPDPEPAPDPVSAADKPAPDPPKHEVLSRELVRGTDLSQLKKVTVRCSNGQTGTATTANWQQSESMAFSDCGD